MRILFVHPNNDYTGSTKVLSDIISEEYAKDQCIVLTINKTKGFLTHNFNAQVKNIWFPTIRNKPIPFISSFLSFVVRVVLCVIYLSKADFVYINTIKPYYAAGVANLFKKKIIWHIHEIFKNKSIPVRIMEFVQKRTDAHFIFVSKYVKDEYLLSRESTWEIKYNKLSKGFLNDVLIRLISDRSLKEILMASSLTKAKGVDTFINLSRIMPSYNFTLVLSCSEDERNRFVENENPPINCKILSRQSSMGQFYHKADILLNLSNPFLCVETFGMTIIEAFAYGVPAIVPNVGGPLEIVDNGVNGYCVNVRDIAEIKEKIIELTNNRNIYAEFSNRAILKAKKFN